MEDKKQKINLPFTIKWLFGIGDITCDMTGTFKNYYWTYFLTTVMGVSLTVTAVISSLTYAGDMICSFLSGFITDAFKPGKWGKYRKVLLVTTIIACVGYVGMWACPLIPGTGLMAFTTVVSAVIFSVFITLATTANSTLISIIGQSEYEKGWLMSHRWGYQKVSGLVVGYIVAGLLAVITSFGGGEGISYAATGILLSALYFIGYGFHFKMANGYDLNEDQAKAKGQDKLTVKDMFQALAVNKHLLAVTLANFFMCIPGMLVSMMVAYIFQFTFVGKMDLMAPYISSISACALLGSIVVGPLIKKFECINIARVAALLSAIDFFAGVLFFRNSLIGFWIVMGFFMFITSIDYVTSLTLFTSCATYSEWKTGKKAHGVVIGITNIPVKVAMFVTGLIIPIALAAAGYDAGAVTVAPEVGYKIITWFLLIPAVSNIVELFIATVFYKLKKADIAKYQEEINARSN